MEKLSTLLFPQQFIQANCKETSQCRIAGPRIPLTKVESVSIRIESVKTTFV